MKPNFALSLSFEGIKLLHRAAGGWREVGEVPVSADDLAGELAMLRKTAASLEPGGVRTKLLIPPSQIKYLTIDTAGLSETARREAAETALQDATPYEVAELAYDISIDGAKTHIAAVARETLAEAEAFATEHRFHPVSFVAVPGDAPYLGEPFFGTTIGAAALLEPEEAVEPDGIAVVVVGAITPEFVPPQMTEVTPVEDTEAEPQDTAEHDAPEQTAVTLDPEPTTDEPADAPLVDADADADEPDLSPLDNEPAEIDEKLESGEALAAQTVEQESDTQTADEAPVAQVPVPPQAKDPAETQKPSKAGPSAHSEPELEPTAAPKAPVVEEKGPSAEQIAQNIAQNNDSGTPTEKPAPAPGPVDPKRAAMLAAAAATGASQPTPKPLPFKAAPRTSEPAPAATPETGFSTRRIPAPAAPKSKTIGGAHRIAVQTPKPDSISTTNAAKVAASAATTPATSTERTRGGFLSRRKPNNGAAKHNSVPAADAPAAGSEAERMTVFGARKGDVGGKPRFLGLIMTVILLVFLAGVAAWAAVFLDDGIAGLIQKDKARATASAPENQIDPEIIRTPEGTDPAQSETTSDVQVASLDPVLSAEETATVEGVLDPRPEPQVPVITEAEAAARYAVTGIWPLAPTTPLSDTGTVDAPVYRSGIDPISSASDALALPTPQEMDAGVQLAAAISPPPFGQRTDLDANGQIVPTEDGVVTPEGFTLFAASPPIKPPVTLARFAAEPTVTAPEATSAMAALRPKNRPSGLAERSERAQLGGVSRGELAAFRPALRPQSVQERAQEAEDAALKAAEQEEARAEAAAQSAAAVAAANAALAASATPVAQAPAAIVGTRFATAQSRRPDTRPRNFTRIVKRAQRAAPQKKETRVAAVATVAPRTVKPSLPSKASVARSATVKNAINLRKVNLIGIYGKPSSRRALVRLGNGRYQKVKVGDRIDGGRVAAISDTDLRYSKGGRNVVLKMP